MQQNSAREMFNPQTKVGQGLAWFWDMIDISENMERIETYTETISNGLASRINVFVFFCLTICALVLAWYFDIESTIEGMLAVTNTVIPGLPLKAVTYSAWIVAAFSVMPTFLEVFTSGLAKANVKIVQISIIAMTLFDVLTDMPRAYAMAMDQWPRIQSMGAFAGIVFWIVYCGIQFMATIGFELATVVFGYATLIFIAKATKPVQSSTRVHAARPRRVHAPQYQQPVYNQPQAQYSNQSVIVPDMTGDNEVFIVGE